MVKLGQSSAAEIVTVGNIDRYQRSRERIYDEGDGTGGTEPDVGRGRVG
jgi:hypothetical protein